MLIFLMFTWIANYQLEFAFIFLREPLTSKPWLLTPPTIPNTR